MAFFSRGCPLDGRNIRPVSTPIESPSPASLAKQSAQSLSSLLRVASNRLEMLLSPDLPHHEDDAERRRIRAMGTDERSALQQEALKTVHEVRAEFRRRLADDR